MCYNPVRFELQMKEADFAMPLVLCTAFFIILFSCEGFWHLSCIEESERELRRYQAVEHPRRRTSDRYLDLLG